MPENILVIEHEPRDADLVRHALAGQAFNASFAADGEQALQALQSAQPRLIILSAGVPKVSAADLIRAIRERPDLRDTPILVTVASGVVTQEAMRLGATDVLAKPFSSTDILGKVRQMMSRGSGTGQLTSNDIFGDIVDEDRSPNAGAKKAMKSDDLDKLLADTLSNARPDKVVKPKTASGSGTFDKKLQDTLSGLEKSARAKTSGGTIPRPPLPSNVAEEKTHFAEPIFIPPPPPAEEEEPTDGVKFGQYVLVDKIATGGMAEVWKARMRGVEGFQKIVAIKKILPHLSDNQEFVEMFVDEAKLAAQLNHNNIIHIYDLGKIQSSYYIAMEYVDGYDLKTILKRAEERDQPLAMELALFIASKIAAALDYAHRKRDFEDREMGLVHRDVSPQNVLISEEGDIKLCDFGIAKAASKASNTQAGALKGKLQYMSPEQAWGRALDRRSDIFALTAVLFEMLTRRKLFTGDSEMSILEQVREARILPPSQINDEVTAEIDAIVLKGLQKDPANRYQTSAEMAKDIDSLLYTFRPTPTSADLAIFMHRLRAAQPMYEATQVLEDLPPIPPPPPPTQPRPAAVTAAAATVAVPMPTWEAPRTAASPLSAPPPRKRSLAVPLTIAAVLAIVAIGGFFFMRGRASTPSATVAAIPATTPRAGAPSARTTDTTATIVDVATVDPATLTATTAAPSVLDPARVNEEVQRRLAAERTRLEQQQTRVTAPPVPAPQPVPAQRAATPAPQPVAPQPVAPQPAVAETRPAPVQPAPQPAAQPAAQPATATSAPATAEPERVVEGQLVTDLDGLVPARMIRRADIPYPPMAKIQRVEGRVLISALVSETGQVLETRVLVPIKKAVGLNEAAQLIVRRSTFSAPTKDGVRVKAWTTVPIDFKL